MSERENLLMRLQDLSQFFNGDSLDDNLSRQTELTARLVGAETCSVMLLNGEPGRDLRLTVCAHYGPLADAARSASVGPGEGIAGRVLDSGRSLLVEDIALSSYAPLARRAGSAGRSLMIAPISIDGRIIGMLCASAAIGKPAFSAADLHMLDVIALFVGKSIQVVQLQRIIESRFLQLALLQDAKAHSDNLASAYRQPDQMARLLAKSLYREMAKAGFDSAQIISAATEIIDQLNHNLQRHSERAARHAAV